MQDGDCQVSRRSESVQSDVISRLDSRNAKTTEADDTCAEQGRRVKIIEAGR